MNAREMNVVRANEIYNQILQMDDNDAYYIIGTDISRVAHMRSLELGLTRIRDYNHWVWQMCYTMARTEEAIMRGVPFMGDLEKFNFQNMTADRIEEIVDGSNQPSFEIMQALRNSENETFMETETSEHYDVQWI